MPQQFSDNSTDKAFRDKLSGLRVEPRSRIWFRVSAGLDRAAALRAHNRRRVIGIAIGVLVIVGVILTAVLDPVATRKKISNTGGNIPEENSTQQIDNTSNINLLNDENESSNTINQFANDIANSSATITVNNIVIPLPEGVNAKDVFITKNISSILPIKSPSIPLSEKMEAEILNEKIMLSVAPQISDDENVMCNCSVSKFYLGIKAAINTTSLVDNAAFQNDKYISKMKYGNSVSVSAGYHLSKNFSAEIGWNIFSNEGQRYGYNVISRTTGKVEDNDYVVGLRYTQIPVMIRFGAGKYSALLHRNMNYSIAFGGMYGRLKNVSYTVAEVPFESRMRLNEFAAVGNFRTETKVSKHLSLNAGINLSFSNSLFMPDYHISPFTQPHSFVAGIEVGVKYSFCKK